MGYETQAQSMLLGLLELFEAAVTDRSSHQSVRSIVADQNRWGDAHREFGEVRRRWRDLDADRRSGEADCHYAFLEACLKTVFNESGVRDSDNPAPFDGLSPFWVYPTALSLAEQLDISLEQVLRTHG